jgi:hypothetical protein
MKFTSLILAQLSKRVRPSITMGSLLLFLYQLKSLSVSKTTMGKGAEEDDQDLYDVDDGPISAPTTVADFSTAAKKAWDEVCTCNYDVTTRKK